MVHFLRRRYVGTNPSPPPEALVAPLRRLLVDTEARGGNAWLLETGDVDLALGAYRGRRVHPLASGARKEAIDARTYAFVYARSK